MLFNFLDKTGQKINEFIDQSVPNVFERKSLFNIHFLLQKI